MRLHISPLLCVLLIATPSCVVFYARALGDVPPKLEAPIRRPLHFAFLKTGNPFHIQTVRFRKLVSKSPLLAGAQEHSTATNAAMQPGDYFLEVDFSHEYSNGACLVTLATLTVSLQYFTPWYFGAVHTLTLHLYVVNEDHSLTPVASHVYKAFRHGVWHAYILPLAWANLITYDLDEVYGIFVDDFFGAKARATDS